MEKYTERGQDIQKELVWRETRSTISPFIPHLTLKYSYFEIDLFRLFLTLTKSIKMRKREGGFWCYKTFFGRNLENIDFPFSRNSVLI